MKYTFTLTGRELLECSLCTVMERYRRQPGRWLIRLLACGLFYEIAGPLAGVFFLVVAAAILTDICRVYSGLKKAGFLEELTLETEGRYLRESGKICREASLGSLNVIRQGRHILMLGHTVSKRQVAWFFLPQRAFASKQEMTAFLNLIKQARTKTDDGTTDGESLPLEEAVFRFGIEMGENRWLQIYTGALRAVRSGAMGMMPGRKNALMIDLIFLGLAAVFQVLFPYGQILRYAAPAFGLLLVQFLLSGRTDPEKAVKKQLKAGNAQKNVGGRLELVLTSKGVYTQLTGEGKSFLPWDRYGWLVEEEGVLYLFQKNKNQFQPIPGDVTESREQWEALKTFCVQKGLAYRQAKSKKPLPAPVYWLIMAVTFLGMVIWAMKFRY